MVVAKRDFRVSLLCVFIVSIFGLSALAQTKADSKKNEVSKTKGTSSVQTKPGNTQAAKDKKQKSMTADLLEDKERRVPRIVRSCAVLTHVKNTVLVRRRLIDNDPKSDQVAFRPKRFEKIGCNDQIETGKASRAIVKGRNFKVALGPFTVIRIDEQVSKKKRKRSIVDMTYGKIRAFVKPSKKDKKKKTPEEQKGASRFKVITKAAVAGVRGTDFYSSFNLKTGKSEQATLKGSIFVERLRDKKTVEVDQGQQVVFVEPSKEEEAKGPKKASAPAVEELKVVPIKEGVAERIRATSSIAKKEKEFASNEAIKVIGKPETWKAPKEQLPGDLDDMENEF